MVGGGAGCDVWGYADSAGAIDCCKFEIFARGGEGFGSRGWGGLVGRGKDEFNNPVRRFGVRLGGGTRRPLTAKVAEISNFRFEISDRGKGNGKVKNPVRRFDARDTRNRV